MNSAYTRLLLLGLVCQGFSWDSYYLPWIYGIAGFICFKVGQKRGLSNQLVDGIALIVGCIFGSALSKALGQSSHFFLGHGLAFVQLSRLLRPLSRRDQIFSLVIAIFHLGVAASIVLDYRFVPIFLVVLWLAPKALMELEAAAFEARVEKEGTTGAVGSALPDVFGGTPNTAREMRALPLVSALRAPSLRLGFVSGVVIFIISLGFFFFFPRVFLGPGGAPIGGGGDQTTLLDSILDPSRGGLAQSDRVLMQVEADRLNYLRLYVLGTYEGGKWLPSDTGNLRHIHHIPDQRELESYPLRKVRVKKAANLGRILPTDGRVMALKGNFFRFPMITTVGTVECQSMWNTANNYYEYRIHERPEPPRMDREVRSLLTKLPPQSAKLRAWVQERTFGLTNDIQKARALESYLSTNFTYRLGAPDLNRLNFVEDFIFNAREGHCERFAAALAHLLRMEGIPSRVVVGYAPSVRNPFTGWYSIRFKDAHAWTEAYLDGVGWVTLDATPAGTGGGNGGWSYGDLLDSLDTIWYSNFVNFDTGMQRNFLSAAVQVVNSGAQWTFNNGRTVLVIALSLGLIVWLPKRLRKLNGRHALKPLPASRIFAEHQYGQMLRALAKLSHHRHPEQTPIEFLRALESSNFELMDPVRLITTNFCDTRYGEHDLTPESRTAAQSALSQLEMVCRNSPKRHPKETAHTP